MEIFVAGLGIRLGNFATYALPFQFRPEKGEAACGLFLSCCHFAAFVVGEKNKTL